MYGVNVGDIVYYLNEYHVYKAKVIKINPKSIKLDISPTFGVKYIKDCRYDKVFSSIESVCVVWECWRGVNGRGGYRIERNKYPQYRNTVSKGILMVTEVNQLGLLNGTKTISISA